MQYCGSEIKIFIISMQSHLFIYLCTMFTFREATAEDSSYRHHHRDRTATEMQLFLFLKALCFCLSLVTALTRKTWPTIWVWYESIIGKESQVT